MYFIDSKWGNYLLVVACFYSLSWYASHMLLINLAKKCQKEKPHNKTKCSRRFTIVQYSFNPEELVLKQRRDPHPPHQAAAPHSVRRCRRWTAASQCAPAQDSGRSRSAAQTEEASPAGSDSTASARIKQEHIYSSSDTQRSHSSESFIHFKIILG